MRELSVLGEGNFGRVTLIEYTYKNFSAKYAKKEFKVKQSTIEEISIEEIEFRKKEFVDEMHMTSYLSDLGTKMESTEGSQNVILLAGFDFSKNQIFLEYCDGNSLESFITSSDNEMNELKINSLLTDVLIQGFKACFFLYKKRILHNDIASRNILISWQNDKMILKLSDYGLSRLETPVIF